MSVLGPRLSVRIVVLARAKPGSYMQVLQGLSHQRMKVDTTLSGVLSVHCLLNYTSGGPRVEEQVIVGMS